MIVRAYQPSDAPALERMAQSSGYPYPDIDSPLIETVRVIEADGRPIAAVAARRLVELFGWFEDSGSTAQKMAALQLLHEDVATELRKRGYASAEAFLPPAIDVSFGKRLERFGWHRNPFTNWAKGF